VLPRCRWNDDRRLDEAVDLAIRPTVARRGVAAVSARVAIRGISTRCADDIVTTAESVPLEAGRFRRHAVKIQRVGGRDAPSRI
jgi:hypothetical protein